MRLYLLIAASAALLLLGVTAGCGQTRQTAVSASGPAPVSEAPPSPPVTEGIWPNPDWETNLVSMHTPACQGFLDFAVRSGTLKTDGLLVIRNGKIEYEYYDPNYGPDQPHALWSVTKTITGALLGIAVRDGKIALNQKLSEFYPKPDATDAYNRIKISDLFYLDTGFIWDEYYAGDVSQSAVLTMLYGPGHWDMANYASSRPQIPQGPGYAWSYTTGTPVITMGVLKQVYGADYDSMPWDKLFNPLGMKNVTFERDPSGTFIGGSAAFMTPRDLARIGYLYLNGGKWKGATILPEDWIGKTLSPSPGYLSSGTVIHDITDDGVYGGSIWLNRAVKPGFGKPYPFSPSDMYLAIGHYGQMLIMLPSQHMLIVRTAHDMEYNSKLDEFVSRAISCFSDPNYPIGKIIPPPATSQLGLGGLLQTLETGIDDDIIQRAVAKSVCSCHFISGVDVDTCIAESNIPAAKQFSDVEVNSQNAPFGMDEVDVNLSWLARLTEFHLGSTAVAIHDPRHPEFGCTLE